MKRTLLITTELSGPGGVQKASRLLQQALSDLGAPPKVVSVHDAPPVGARGSKTLTTWNALRSLRRDPWDLVVVAHLHLAPLARLLYSRAPILTVVHGIEAWVPLTRSRAWGVQGSRGLLFNSSYTRTRSENVNPLLAELPGTVCHWGLGPTLRPSAERSNQVLCIGRMSVIERYKGHEELIRCWPEVQKQRPGLELVFIGDGDDRARLEPLARSLKVPVHFLGNLNSIEREDYLARCVALALPSREEGFGFVYLEAMRAGKPVLAGRGAAKELVLDGITGRTIDPFDEISLIEGLLDVTGNAAERMGAAGKARFESYFSYSRFQERFETVVESCLGNAKNKIESQDLPLVAELHP